MPPTHLSLFSGIGGIDLAAEWAGFETVGQVEIDPFCRRVLAKHWPDVPRWEDIREFTGEGLAPTLISGGFPCQPFSAAGKRRGKDDDRHLWPEMLRVVRLVRPAWVLGENVAHFVNMALDDVCADLEGEGYEVGAFVLPAASVGAPHLRQRCFVVAHAAQFPEREPADKPHPLTIAGRAWDESRHGGTDVAHGESQVRAAIARTQRDQWESEPDVGRLADGVPDRMARLRAWGNAVVPQQVYPILAAIAAYERGGRDER